MSLPTEHWCPAMVSSCKLAVFQIRLSDDLKMNALQVVADDSITVTV